MVYKEKNNTSEFLRNLPKTKFLNLSRWERCFVEIINSAQKQNYSVKSEYKFPKINSF